MSKLTICDICGEEIENAGTEKFDLEFFDRTEFGSDRPDTAESKACQVHGKYDFHRECVLEKPSEMYHIIVNWVNKNMRNDKE